MIKMIANVRNNIANNQKGFQKYEAPYYNNRYINDKNDSQCS